MKPPNRYQHIQRAPLCLLLYVLAAALFVLAWILRAQPPIAWLFPTVGVFVLTLAASMHYLKVEDEGERLAIRFGPLPLFRQSVRYDQIVSAQVGRTTIFEGWGIHRSLRGGWVWNIWGRDCVVIQQRDVVLRVGTDDAEQLVAFLNARISER